MSQVAPWLALGSLLSGAVSLWFVRYLWPSRDRLGEKFFVATIGCGALWSLSYGVALFVFDPALRELFEVPIWLAIDFVGVFFLAFALEYTGRGNLVRSKLMGGVVGVQVGHTLVVLTNAWHRFAWREYAVEPLYGAATVTYTHQPWLFVNVTGVIVLIAAACFLLADTVFSYGPRYRREAAAIALSPIFPGVPLLVWSMQVGASPPLNLTPLLFPFQFALVLYAFSSRDMFELSPVARRVAERAAIEDLGLAVVIVDTDGRIVDSNREAGRVLDVDPDAMLGDDLDTYLADVDPTVVEQQVSLVVDGQRREYTIATSPLEDSTGTHVGDSLVLQDVTTAVKREQRLAVLNRALRHNLRNDLNIVHGFLGIALSKVDDPAVRGPLETAESKTAAVMALGEKARDIEQVVSTTVSPTVVPVDPIVEQVVSDLQGAFPEATIDVAGEDGVAVVGEPQLLDRVLRTVVENALQHAGRSDPTVEVRVETANPAADGGAESASTPDDSAVVSLTISDDGPGIPEHEIAALSTTRETTLEHGSGLGLWLVAWGVDALGGRVEVETDESGTRVQVVLQAAENLGDGPTRTEGGPTGPSPTGLSGQSTTTER